MAAGVDGGLHRREEDADEKKSHTVCGGVLFLHCKNRSDSVRLVPFFLMIVGVWSGWAQGLSLKKWFKRTEPRIIPGAERFDRYVPRIEWKNVAVVTNHSALVGENYQHHLVDTLLAMGVPIKKIFSPEHGFRGQAPAGWAVRNSVDKKTGLPVISLYGKKKAPSREDLAGINVVLFDIQDVGVRCFTYISTLYYVMEACARTGKKLIVLDRPNPNIHYVDGPTLDTNGYRSFVGMFPIPLVYGMTIGELAQMINGEYWLPDSLQCRLEVIPVANYSRTRRYRLPVPPSPNLRSMAAVYLYPTLVFFEPTEISVGRGTSVPFEIFGRPGFPFKDTVFVPQSLSWAPRPKYLYDTCNGVIARRFADKIREEGGIYIEWLVTAYQHSDRPDRFFEVPSFFDKLAGTGDLRKQIMTLQSPAAIRASWKEGIEAFKKQREKYLIYP